MDIKHLNAEQIITNLHEADSELARGKSEEEVCRRMGIDRRTYQRWRTQYSAVTEMHRLRELGRLERENARLKRGMTRQESTIALFKVLGA